MHYPRGLISLFSSVSILLVGLSATAAGLPSGLVAYWPGEDNAADTTGNNPGTLANGTTFTAGRVNRAFHLDGVDDYVELGALPSVSGADALTVMAWVRRSHGDFSVGGIVGQWNTGGAGNNRFLLYNSEGVEAGKCGFAVDLDGGGAVSVGGTTLLPVGEWVHVAAVFRGADGFTAIYKNGVLEASANAPAGRRLTTVATPTGKIGEWGELRSQAYKWPGDLDEVAIFTRALSAEEIQQVISGGVLSLAANDEELLIQGSNANGHVDYQTAGFLNRGRIRFESINAGYLSGMTVAGILTNASTGLVNFNVGSGGPRRLRGGFWNQGTVNVNQDTEFGGEPGWFRNDAFLTTAAGVTLSLTGTGTQFLQQAGLLQNNGGFLAAGTRFDFLGGEVKGNPVYIDGGILNLGNGVPGEGHFILTRSTSELRGNVGPNTEIWFRGDGRGGHSIPFAATGLENRGLLRLESRDAGYTSGFRVEGVLSNRTDGRITSEGGSGGPRPLQASLRNEGSVTVNDTLQLGREGALHVNRGSIEIAPSQSLVLAAGAQTFRQEAGELNIDGGFDATGIDFQYAGGAVNGIVYLDSSRFVGEPSATGPGYFMLTRSDSHLAGSLQSGQIVQVRGDGRGNHTQIMVEPGFVNRGEVRLESANAGYSSSLEMPVGTFRNTPGGLISFNPGAGGPRNFAAPLFNEGTMTVNQPGNLGRDGAMHTNRGTIHIVPGVNLVLSQPNQIFRQEAGLIDAEGTFDGTNLRFEFAGGEVRGSAYFDNSILHIVPGAQGPAEFMLTASSSLLSGALQRDQSVWIRGDARGNHTDVELASDFANRGTLRLASVGGGYNSSLHQGSGSLRNLVGGRLVVDPGAGGPRNVGVELRNDGEVFINQPTGLGRAGATHVNRGTISVVEGVNLRVASGNQVFRQEAGALNFAGTGDFTSLRFDFLGGSVAGTAYLDSCTLFVAPGNAAPGAFMVTGSSTRLEGETHPGQSIWIRGDPRGDHTEILLAPGFVNGGEMHLASVAGGYTTSMRQEEGQLLNREGGLIRVDPGAGGPRNLRVELVNEGTVEVSYGAGLGRAGATHINRGQFHVAPGVAFGLLSDGQTFRQEAGEMNLESIFSAAEIRFDYLGGLVTGPIYLRGSDLRFGPGAGAGGDFIVTGSATRLRGRVPAGASLWVRGDAWGDHTSIDAPEGLVNAGYLQLASVNGGYTTALTVTSGELVNEASGLIEVNPGAGGPRGLGVVLNNHGEFRVNYPVTLGRGGEAGRSDGTIRLGDTTLTLNGPLQVTGGTLTGNGTFAGTVINRGTVAPGASAGALSFNGTFTQEAGGVVDLELGGTAPTQFDRVTFNGPAQVDGVIRVRLIDGHQPALGNSYAVINGRFTGSPRLELPRLAAGLRWATDLSAGLTLSVEESPASPFKISGRVANSEGAPVAGLTVQAEDATLLGLVAEMWNQQSTNGTPVTRRLDPTVNFYWGGGQPDPAVGGDNFYVRWSGELIPRFTETYTLSTASDDGSWVWIDDQLVVDNGGLHSMSERGASIALEAGRVYRVRIEMHENGGEAGCQFFWASPSQAREIVPSSALRPAGDLTGLTIVDRFVVSSITDAQGNYSIPVGAGEWRVMVNGVEALGFEPPAPRAVTVTTTDKVQNFVLQPAVVPRFPDLIITDVAAPATAVGGQTVQITWQSRNSGDGPATAPWRETVLLARQAGGFDAQPLGSLDVADSLVAGASASRQLNVTLPAGLVGRYWVLVRADATLQVDEGTREGNNTTAAPQGTDLLIGDLVVDSVTAPTELSFGASAAVTWVVRNAGGAVVNLPWKDSLRFSANPAGRGVALAAVAAPVKLHPGESYTNTSTVVLPLAGQNAPGTYYLLVLTDGDGQQVEANNNNNLGASAAINVLAPPPPDLVVAEVIAPAIAPVGQPVSLIWTVKNTGLTRAVAPWQEQLRLATDAAGNDPFTLVTLTINESLEPGAEIRRTNNVILPAEQVGSRFLIVAVDVADDVAETGPPENNIGTTQTAFTVAAPNLLAEELHVPSSATLASDFQVTWKVRNSGNVAVASAWSDRLVLHTSAGPVTLLMKPAGDKVPLAAGAVYERTENVRLPLLGGVEPGTYAVSIETDSGAEITEALETDNVRDTGNLPLTIQLPPLPDLQVAAVSFPENALAGAEVDVTWTVTNAGPATAIGPWQESLVLSPDETPGGDVPLVSITVEQSLAPGASLSHTERVRIPASLAGVFTIFAGTDVDRVVVEGNETNNFAAAAKRINLPAKLTLQLAVGSVTEADAPPVVRGRLFRTGDVNAPLTVTLTSSDTNEITVPETVVIPAGAPVVDVNFGIKADGVVDGPKTVTLTADANGFVAGSAIVIVQDVNKPLLTLALDAPMVIEGLTVGATVSRPTAGPDPLEVTVLTGSTELLGPTTVTIPANAKSTTFTIIALDDPQLDLARQAEVRVTAADYLPGTAALRIEDNDQPGLSVTVEPAVFSEAAGALAARAIVTRTNVTGRPLLVQLRVSDDSEAVVQPTVIIRGGQTSAEVFLSAVNDISADGPQQVQLRAYVTDATGSQTLAEATPASFTVTDDDGPALRLVPGNTLAREGRNPAFSVVVVRNSDTNQPLTVQLSTSDSSEATAPATVVIPAGATAATFPITTLNDGIVDGNQRVTLTAAAEGHAPGTTQFTVSDAELPDLIVSEVTAPANGVTRGLFEVGYRVTNQGFDQANGTILQRIIASRDPVLDDKDEVLNETPFNATMPVGESFSRTLTVFAPRETGDWWIFVVVDAEDAIRETLENNNATAAAVPFRVEPSYTATVETDITTAPAGTAIPLRGHAVKPSGAPAVGELVNIHVVLDGARRKISALTDSLGNFTATFQPLPTEAGSYTLGAAHPGVAEAPVQDRFNLVGLRVNPIYARQTILPGTVARTEFELLNISAQTLTGITAKAGAVDGLEVRVDAPAQLAAGATGRVVVSSAVPEPRDAAGRFVVTLTSTEGATVDITLDYLVELPQPRLVANPHALEQGMVRGRQTLVEFEVVNTGGAPSGPLNLTLPDLPWMRAVTATPIASIPPGGSTKITLQLTPDSTVPLDIYEGRLAVHNEEAGVAVPFKFRHVSDAVGDVAVTVVDEMTYYGQGGPKVANATVVLRDAFTSEALHTGITDTNGVVTFPGVPEGPYNLDVTAPKHDNYLQTVQVAPGKVNEYTAFIRTQLVRYNWKVEEIDIEERAKITLETIFETTVPVPVVTVEPSSIDLTGIEADEYQVELKITNHGLIAAQEVNLQSGAGSRWQVQLITDNIGVIPAKSSLTVPVIFRRIGSEGEGVQSRLARQGITRQAGGAAGCDNPRLGIDWRLICGPFGVAYWVPVPVIDQGLCPPPPSVGSNPAYLIGGIPAPIGGGGGGGGGGGIGVGWGGRGFATYSATNDCSCSKQTYVDRCAAAEGGFKGELKGFAEQLVNAAASSLAYTRVLGVEVKLSGAGKLCSCCEEVNGQGVVGLKAEGSITAQIEAKVFFGPSVRWKQEVSVSGLSEAEGEFFAGGGVELATTGYASLKASTECLLKNPEICMEGGIASKVFVGAKASGKVAGKLPSGQAVAAGVEGVIGIEGGFSARTKMCRKNGQTTTSNNVCRDAIVAKGSLQFSVEATANESEVGDVAGFLSGSLGVEKELVPQDCPGESSNAEPVLLAAESEAQTVARWFGHSSPAELAAAVAPSSATTVAQLPDDASGPELSQALVAAWPARTALPQTVKEVVFDNVTQAASAEDWSKAAARAARARRPRKAAGDNGVCAQVRLQIEQEAVVTRKAIGATLELINESEDTELQDVGVTINIYDRNGNLANDRFIVLAPELTRFTPMGGEQPDSFVFNGMALRLAPATTGSARWVILPKDEAAPEDVEQYFVGGVLAYTAGGVPGTAELTPGQVKVYPNAKLELKYFHQRDVFSDDPFTDETEPSIPFTLGVMVHNKGRGLARNMHIISAQPKIVENVKGLLIDFSIIATEVAGKSLTPSLTAEFGDINPGDTAIGRWLLKSTLQGLFIDYKATLEHEDRFSQPGASVFDSVEIHELIHQVEALGSFADGKPDFLVNDLPDDEDLPDTVHLSDATTAPVSVVRAASSDGAPTANDLEVVLTAPMPQGFAYLRVLDPANGGFRLAGVKRSDGRVLAVDINAWTTDRTFLGMGKRPRYENILHLFDHDSTGSYTLTYVRDERVPDTTAPVSRVASLPANSPALIPVSWAGEDDTFGSGVTSYDLYVSINGGQFQRWLQNTRNTSGLYPGSTGRTYAFYSRARDAAGNIEDAPLAPQATTFTTGNSAPTVDTIAAVTVDEGDLIDFIITGTDADIPADALSYSLANAPAGMTVDANTGRVRWQTGEADGPATYTVVARVTDNGSPTMSGEREFRVTVRERNVAPTLEPLAGPFTAREGEVFELTFHAEDADLPVQPLRFRLAEGAPAGATINPVTGVLQWIPGETTGGTTVQLGVIVSDSQSPELTATTGISVQVTETNSAPILAPIGDQIVWEGDLLTLPLTANDPDIPAQVLHFGQSGNEGLATQLNPLTGVFSWLPVEAEVPNTNHITITVADDGTPVLSASQSFTLVGRALKQGLNRPQRFPNGDMSFRFKGTAGRHYMLEGSTDFETWTEIHEFVADPAILTITDQTSSAFPWRYFRARALN